MTFFDPKTAVIGGRVFSDSNADNTEFSASGGFEAGLDGQLVQLLDAHGNVIQATHTDHNGFYSFTHLASGDYFVQFPSRINDLTLADKDIGGFREDSDANVDSGLTDPIHLQAGESKTEVDAGYQFQSLPDGVVDGADTGEFMPLHYADAQGDMITNGDDHILGNGGNDNIRAGDGNDFVDGGVGNDYIEGNAGNDTILGGEGNDNLRGGDGNDFIDGGVGDEYIEGNAGHDTILGGEGNDNLRGGNDNDQIEGGTGNDFISGDAGDDRLFGGDGADDLRGGTGKDFLVGGDGNDQLMGGADADALRAGAGDDRLFGEDGNDDMLGGSGDDLMDGGTGDDFMGGQDGDDHMNGGDGNDFVAGDDGADVMKGGAGHDTLVGGAGADLIEGGAGDDLITFDNPFVDNEDPTTDGAGDMIFGGAEGALDNDTLDLRGAGKVTIDQQIDENDEGATKGTVTFADGSTLTFEGIETILSDGDGTVDGAETGEFMPVGYADAQGDVITEGDDRIFGNGGNDDIRSGGGDDFIDGGTGNDNIFGGTGNDFILAGDGDDVVRGREDDDYIDAGAGNDNIMGEEGDDALRGRAGDDFVAGGSGNDDILGEDGNDSLYGDTGDDFIGGGAGDDIVSDALEGFVGGGNDQFYGDDGNDTLLGGDGHDTLVGGADADRIEGGAGDDLITFDNPFVDNEDPTTDGAGDMIFGGAEGALDNDTLDLRGAGKVTIDQQIDENDEGATKGTVTFADGSTLTFEGIETILSDGDGTVDGAETGEFMPVGYADAQGDVITEGDDRIFGNGGNDDIRSGGGDDFIDGGTGNDNIFGGTGNDFILAGDGDDVVRGREDDDYIDAGAGNDNIMGEEGDDALRGRAGDDFVAGGSGNDDILGEDGNDSLYGDTGDDFIGGGAGDDIVSDALEGFVGGGNDQFYGDDGNDTLLGGDGHDTLVGGADADRIEGGAGDDLITFDNPFVDNEDPTTDGAGDMIFGGAEGALDNDTLDLRGAGKVTIDQQIDENDEGATKGTVTFADGSTLTFEGIETILSDGEVNAAPVAVDDAAVALEDGSVTIDVLSNDIDPEEDSLTVTQASAENGTVTVNDDNSLEYTPDPGFFGTDIITYEISDGFGNTDTGEVTVEVEEVPDAPVVDGTAGDDVLLSDFVDEDGDQIDGTDGLNDTIDAGAGNDFVDGGAGDDTFLDNAGNDVYFGNEGNDSYVSQDTGNVFVFVGEDGTGQVQNVTSGELDEVFSVETFVAGEDETGFDGIAFENAISEDDIATQLQGISDNAFGQFFPDAAPPVAFGPEVGLLLSDILGGAVGGSPVGNYLIEGGDEEGQIGEVSFENFEQIFFGVEMSTDREVEERAFEEMRMREELREEEEELDRMGFAM